MAIRDGYINKDSVNNTDQKGIPRETDRRYMNEKDMKPHANPVYVNSSTRKILRATYC